MKLTQNDLAEIENVEYIYSEVVTKFGNGAKVSAPKKFLGQDCIVIIKKLDPRNKLKNQRLEEEKENEKV